MNVKKTVHFGLLLFVFLFSCSISLRTWAQDQGSSIDARLVSAEGDVTVFYHDQGDHGVPADKGMPLAAGDKVVTGAESHSEVGLDGDSVMEIGSNSEFIVDSLEPKSSAFSLNFGSLLAKIKSLVETGGQMRVNTPTAVAAVRGTEFGVETAPDGVSHVGVFDEGHVAVGEKGGAGAEVMLEPNQETSVEKGQKPQAARPLQRFLERRARMQAVRRRLATLRKNWRQMSPAQRQELRQKMFQRRQRLMQKIRERRKALKEEGRDRRKRRFQR